MPALFARLLATVALLVAAQLGGGERTVVDVIHLFTGTTGHDGLECNDDAGKPCAPDCPVCHCAPVGPPAPPMFDVAFVLEVPDPGVVLVTFFHDRTPSSPHFDSLYRPPRLCARRA